MAHLVRIGHTLIVNGVRRTGRSGTLTLRIMRFDGYVYDWTNDQFSQFGAGGLGTIDQNPDAEPDASNDPGHYYWELGAGTTIDDVLPSSFDQNGEYRFELSDSGISYEWTWAVEIRSNRVYAKLLGQGITNTKELTTTKFRIYEDDGSQVALEKTVKDKGGGAITLDTGVPTKEEA